MGNIDKDVDINWGTREIKFTSTSGTHTVADLYEYIKNIDGACVVCQKKRMKREAGFVMYGELRMACKSICSTYLSWTERLSEQWQRCTK